MVSGIVKAEVVESLTSPLDDVVPGGDNSGFGVWNNQPAFKHTDKDYTKENNVNLKPLKYKMKFSPVDFIWPNISLKLFRLHTKYRGFHGPWLLTLMLSSGEFTRAGSRGRLPIAQNVWRIFQISMMWTLAGCARSTKLSTGINCFRNTIKENVIYYQIKAYFPENALAPSVYTQRIVVFISTVSVIYFAISPFYLQVRVFRCTGINS